MLDARSSRRRIPRVCLHGSVSRVRQLDAFEQLRCAAACLRAGESEQSRVTRARFSGVRVRLAAQAPTSYLRTPRRRVAPPLRRATLRPFGLRGVAAVDPRCGGAGRGHQSRLRRPMAVKSCLKSLATSRGQMTSGASLPLVRRRFARSSSSKAAVASARSLLPRRSPILRATARRAMVSTILGNTRSCSLRLCEAFRIPILHLPIRLRREQAVMHFPRTPSLLADSCTRGSPA
jgi:hypothetical protein